MRIAAIDLGTNSFHLEVATISPGGKIEVIEKARAQVMLGAGGLADRTIQPDAWQRGLDALKRFADVARTLGCEDIHTAATSAVREAANGPAFCHAVKDKTGLHVRVVSGMEEGRLIWLGARADLDPTRGPVLLFDLGGGSTELIHADARDARLVRSLPIGHIRLAEAFDTGEVLTVDARKAMKRHVRAHLAPVVERVPADAVDSVIGTSGTIRCLARMATLARGEPLPAHDHGLVLRRADLEALLDRFMAVPKSRLDELPGMDPKRRATLPSGAVVVREVMKAWAVDALVTSEHSLRDGLVVDWVEKHRPEIDLAGTYTDPRERAVRLTMQRYGADVRHAEQVARLALQLFDRTRAVHELGEDDRDLLRAAALLHDIGKHVAGEGHHKHGAYLLEHTRLSGFTAPEIAVLAAVVRYHTRSTPKGHHPRWRALPKEDRERVRVLAGLLRIADGLDRGRTQVVTEVTVQLDRGKVAIEAHLPEPAELERWATEERLTLLAKALDREITITFSPPAGAA